VSKRLRKWSLRDLVDFELLLGREEFGRKWKESWRGGVGEALAEEVSAKKLSEKERRGLGFLWMTDELRREVKEDRGARVQRAFGLVEVLVFGLMVLVGVAVLRGFLTEFRYFMESGDEVKSVTAKGFHIWALLGVGVVLPLVMLLLGLMGYWLWRKWSGGLGMFRGMMAGLVKRVSGVDLDKQGWSRLLEQNAVKEVVTRRLGRILQFGGVGYALGMMAGLFGAMLFLEVGFFWETSLPQFGEKTLVKVTEGLETPLVDVLQGGDVGLAKLSKEPVEEGVLEEKQELYVAWFSFFLLVIGLWVLLPPRFLLWLAAGFGESSTLKKMDFQEGRHRALWREVAKVERGEVKSSQADGVVLLDVGGVEMETETVRPFLLQELRVSPVARHSLGVIDEKKELAAIEAVRGSERGVVFLVEGWNLSPKQMVKHYERVKEALAEKGSERKIRFVVIGGEEEYKEWVKFVDGLKDELVEVVFYEA